MSPDIFTGIIHDKVVAANKEQLGSAGDTRFEGSNSG